MRRFQVTVRIILAIAFYSGTFLIAYHKGAPVAAVVCFIFGSAALVGARNLCLPRETACEELLRLRKENQELLDYVRVTKCHCMLMYSRTDGVDYQVCGRCKLLGRKNDVPLSEIKEMPPIPPFDHSEKGKAAYQAWLDGKPHGE